MNAKKVARIVAATALVTGAVVIALAPEAAAQKSYTAASGTLRGVSVELNGTIQAVALSEQNGPLKTYAPCSPTKIADHPHLLLGYQSGYTAMLQIQDGKCFMRVTVNR
jgi:hypothetical protein